MSEIKQIPANFKTIISDWTKDLSTTFPEYSYLWQKWSNPDISELEIRVLYDYCMTVYPERFFDILYQNLDLFTSDKNTCFLPGVEFKLLFNCPDISETTQKAMWNYLQLVLFTIVGSINDKSKFGESANMFNDLEEEDLHSKLKDAMTNISEFFQNLSDQQTSDSKSNSWPNFSQDSSNFGQDSSNFSKDSSNFSKDSSNFSQDSSKFSQDSSNFSQDSSNFSQDSSNFSQDSSNFGQDSSKFSKDSSKFSKDSSNFGQDSSDYNNNMPNVDDLHGHLKGLFNGKIGNLAKELADEISGDMADILGKDGDDIKNTADVFKNMMKNPTKITGLIKTVSDKLQKKMNSGEISQDELMKEATEILGKMKGMSGGSGGDFQEMFKNMAKGMGMNIPKNSKMDTNALDRMTKQSAMKTRMQEKMIEKREKEALAVAIKQKTIAEQIANYKPYDFLDEDNNKAKNKSKHKIKNEVFRIEGDEKQMTSLADKKLNVSITPISSTENSLTTDTIVSDAELIDLNATSNTGNSNNKKKKKKSKK